MSDAKWIETQAQAIDELKTQRNELAERAHKAEAEVDRLRTKPMHEAHLYRDHNTKLLDENKKLQDESGWVRKHNIIEADWDAANNFVMDVAQALDMEPDVVSADDVVRLRDALKMLALLVEHETNLPKQARNGVGDWGQDEGETKATEIIQEARERAGLRS